MKEVKREGEPFRGNIVQLKHFLELGHVTEGHWLVRVVLALDISLSKSSGMKKGFNSSHVVTFIYHSMKY